MFHHLVLSLLLGSAFAFCPAITLHHHPRRQSGVAVSPSSMLHMGKVIVELEKVKGLQDKDTLGTSDPYVKFELEQDNWIMDKDYGDRRSSRKGGETSPEYNETFEWNGVDSLKNVVLRCKVMDDDPLFDDKIGSCVFHLDDLGLSHEPKEFVKVVDNNWFSQDAKIYLKIAYQQQ